MQELTARQRQLLLFIGDYIVANSFPPCRQEMMKAMNIAGYFAIHNHLIALVKKGYIKTIPRTARGIVIIKEAPCSL